MVKIQNGFHGTAFPYTMSTTQGGLVSPTLFNVVTGNAIRTWIDMTVEDKMVAHDRLGETVGRCLGVFYANDGMVGSRDANWLLWMQHLMNVLVLWPCIQRCQVTHDDIPTWSTTVRDL